ncbi:MAG: hypothetical protein QM778_38210 [Myxococcales bacterium]
MLGDIPPDALGNLDAGALDPADFSDAAAPMQNGHKGAPDAGDPASPAPDDSAGDGPDEPPVSPEEPATPEPTPTPAPGEPCTAPTNWYADQDGDGYGSGPAKPSCGAPGKAWAQHTGDCEDNNRNVHPGQKNFFGDGFVRLDGAVSFDYDCSGGEEGNPSQSIDPKCATTVGPTCSKSGYLKTARAANGANAYCGSKVLESCATTLTVVFCKANTETVATPYACR